MGKLLRNQLLNNKKSDRDFKMQIKVLASGSKGNCYRVQEKSTSILIECGLSLKVIQQALDFKLSNIDGVLVSHCHKDHSKAAKDLLKAGIDVYASGPTVEASGLSGHRVHVIESLKRFEIGNWAILPFDIKHDCEGSLGFLLANTSGDKLLYATDTPYLKYRFKGLTHLMIEANYSSEILSEAVTAGITPRAVKSRVIEAHFSLKNVKRFLKVTDLGTVKEIHLLHLSNANANAEKFKREIQALTGKMVFVC